MGNLFSSGNKKQKTEKCEDLSSEGNNDLEHRRQDYPTEKCGDSSSHRNRDLERHRHDSQINEDKGYPTNNARFYKNKLKSYPDGDFIENILTHWKGDYERLERHHGYIQWLFPIRQTGMNSYAQNLLSHEVEAIMDDPEAFERVLRAYEMMLDFYGMVLSDKVTGKISRATNWKDRFQHLNGSYHNYLRITRILAFLGEFGYEQYKRPFVEFVLQEAMEQGTLINTLKSCERYWIDTINLEEDRKQLRDYIRQMEACNTSMNAKSNTELGLFDRADKLIEKSKENVEEKENGSHDNIDMSKTEWREKMKEALNLLKDDSSYFTDYRYNDLELYRQGYPGKTDDKRMSDNVMFYKNKLNPSPHGDFIENMLTKWKGDYERLEKQHGYMQWLFPLRESGMNSNAKELQMHEITAIMDDPEAFERLLRSYEMMLDFYGMVLLDKVTGKISRAKNWKSRFQFLNGSYHNYLRITRILKFLGEFGYEQYKRPFVEFVLQEAMGQGTLINTLESCVRYWLETIKSADDRKQLRDYIRKTATGCLSMKEEDDTELVSGRTDKKIVEKSVEDQTGFDDSKETEDRAMDNLDERANVEWREKVKYLS